MTGLLDNPAIWVVLGATAVAAFTDLWRFRVPNWLTLALLATGPIYHAVVGGWSGLAESALGLGFGFGVLFVFYLMGGVGAGDVKLMGGVGGWLGMPLIVWVFVAASLAGGLTGAVLIVLRNRRMGISQGLAEAKARAYAAALAAGSGSILGAAQELAAPASTETVAVDERTGGEHRITVETRRKDRRFRLVPLAAMTFIGVLAASAGRGFGLW